MSYIYIYLIKEQCPHKIFFFWFLLRESKRERGIPESSGIPGIHCNWLGIPGSQDYAWYWFTLLASLSLSSELLTTNKHTAMFSYILYFIFPYLSGMHDGYFYHLFRKINLEHNHVQKNSCNLSIGAVVSFSPIEHLFLLLVISLLS